MPIQKLFDFVFMWWFVHSVDRIKPVWNYLEDHLEDYLEQNHLACKKKIDLKGDHFLTTKYWP